MGFDTSFSKWSVFRNDKEKRDFIACGAAAGIAAAFGAPLGGVMFCLEEVGVVSKSAFSSCLALLSLHFSSAVSSCLTLLSLHASVIRTQGASFWNPSLTWRTLFSAMTAAFVADFFASGLREGKWGSLTSPGVLAFGESDDDDRFYRMWEMPCFLILGAIGGLMGAAFNALNTRMTILRVHTHACVVACG